MTSSSGSVFVGFRFPWEVISVAVRWYLRYGPSYRDLEELLAERGVTVDAVHVLPVGPAVHTGVRRGGPASTSVPGDHWFVDETYVRSTASGPTCTGRSTSLGRSSTCGCPPGDLAAARAFFTRALATGVVPVEVTTDQAPAYPRVLDELIPTAMHNTKQHANNTIEADHGRLKARLRPMRGLKRFRSARILATGHAFVRNLRRGHYEN